MHRYFHVRIWTTMLAIIPTYRITLCILLTLTPTCESQGFDSFLSLMKLLNDAVEYSNGEPPDQIDLSSEYDFIIVGAGTAGCVLANRLTEISNWKVLLIEAGDNENFVMDIPLLVSYIQFTSANWKYKTEPSNNYCAGLKNKQCLWPRGKVLGGSSVLNFMVYSRGSQDDFDSWKLKGSDGWGWHDVLPYFKKIENFNIPSQFDSEYHGKGGHLNVEYAPYQSQIARAWISAAQEYGFKYVDYNGPEPSGVSRLQLSIKDGARHSSNGAYLHPVRDRPNLHVSKNSLVTKLLFDDTNTKVIGVEIVKNNKTHKILARKEVIVSAGAINSPKLLMLSGIGPKDHLESLKINVIKNLSVGQNLMDHIATGGIHFLINSTAITLDYVLNHMGIIFQWAKYRKGVFSLPDGCEALAYMDLNDKFNTTRSPDIELLLISGGLNSIPLANQVFGFDEKTFSEVFGSLGESDTFMIFPMLMRPKSKGRILLRSRNPNVYPKLIPNYLEYEEDVQKIVEAIKIAIGISNQPALKKLGAKIYDVPIKECLKEGPFGSDSYFACQTRMYTFTIYHQSGTCKMGAESDPTAVVDSRLRVHGIKNLRVIDASIMPEIVSMHTNAATYMIAEKGADMIKQDWDDKDD